MQVMLSLYSHKNTFPSLTSPIFPHLLSNSATFPHFQSGRPVKEVTVNFYTHQCWEALAESSPFHDPAVRVEYKCHGCHRLLHVSCLYRECCHMEDKMNKRQHHWLVELCVHAIWQQNHIISAHLIIYIYNSVPESVYMFAYNSRRRGVIVSKFLG